MRFKHTLLLQDLTAHAQRIQIQPAKLEKTAVEDITGSWKQTAATNQCIAKKQCVGSCSAAAAQVVTSSNRSRPLGTTCQAFLCCPCCCCSCPCCCCLKLCYLCRISSSSHNGQRHAAVLLHVLLDARPTDDARQLAPAAVVVPACCC
jgi:hypothetical protein